MEENLYGPVLSNPREWDHDRLERHVYDEHGHDLTYNGERDSFEFTHQRQHEEDADHGHEE